MIPCLSLYSVHADYGQFRVMSVDIAASLNCYIVLNSSMYDIMNVNGIACFMALFIIMDTFFVLVLLH